MTSRARLALSGISQVLVGSCRAFLLFRVTSTFCIVARLGTFHPGGVRRAIVALPALSLALGRFAAHATVSTSQADLSCLRVAGINRGGDDTLETVSSLTAEFGSQVGLDC
jgi:hypothetical protein